VPISNVTQHLSLALPNSDNQLVFDIERLISALNAIDLSIYGKASPGDITSAVASAISSLVSTAPTGLNTLAKIATAINGDAGFASTVNLEIAAKANPSDITAAISALVASAPTALNTLKKISDAIGADPAFATNISSSISGKAGLASPTFTGTVGGITKTMVGLGSVDNTADADKPVSYAQATAVANTSGRNWYIKNTSYIANNGDKVAVNTAGGVVTITLPPSPSEGMWVEFCDAGRAFATYSMTVARNASTIEALAQDMVVSTNGASFGLVYTGTTWRVY